MKRQANSKKSCEYLRHLSKERFDKVRSTWIDLGQWASPSRVKWLLSQTEGERNNRMIVDPTHILALRSYVAGFLEGNTSASRPWYRLGTSDPDLNEFPAHRTWLWEFTRRTLNVLGSSNFYHEAGSFYYDHGTFNTGCHVIDETERGLFFHTLVPGSYYLINNGRGEPVVLIREFSLTVKAIVDEYGAKDEEGNITWSNFSPSVKKMYDESNYTQKVDIVHVIKENDEYNPTEPDALLNRQWISLTYELGRTNAQSFANAGGDSGLTADTDRAPNRFLKKVGSNRKPFIVGKSQSSNNFEYGEKGPTLDALGLIKSLNKKAISKDQALEQMIKPTLQGPAHLKKSYITNSPNKFIPLDATASSQQGVKRVFEINPAIGALIQDTGDLRRQVDQIYFADFLLFLSQNPKTRTATETNAIVNEQQLVIGPNLQSLDWTYNGPIVDFVSNYVLEKDPWVQANPPPEGLLDKFIRPEFISVFAQAQKAADLPAIDRYIAMVGNVAQINPAILDKANLDRLADIYEDRLYLPPGLNNPQGQVDATRQQRQVQAAREKALEETLPAVAGAAKDMGIKAE